MNDHSSTISLNKFNKLLFFAVLFELFMGGGGRITEFGFLTLRMVLFFLMMTINIPIFIATKKIKKYIIELLVIFTLYQLFHTSIALINNAPLFMIFEDIKPLTYFYSFIFFYNNIKELSDIKYIIRILKISSITMAALYIIVYILLRFNLIDFSILYDQFSMSGEFYFRGKQAFFYKGFFYLCISFLFFYSENKLSSKCLSIFIFIAIVLTFTRGFLLSIVLSYIIFNLVSKNLTFKTMTRIFFHIFIFFLFLVFYSTQEIGNKTVSNSIRLTTIQQVYEGTGLISSFIGHGFGHGVAIRNQHMEISFLEIFYKQGIIGLVFWIYLFVLVVQFYNRAINNGNRSYANPLLLTSIFTYILSFTNPFINNPIGMSMLIISIISLNILGTRKNNDIRLYSNM